MLLLALSCLQGRPQTEAAYELLSLGVEGLQFTPGNAPSNLVLKSEDLWACRTHHGFTRHALRASVWSTSSTPSTGPPALLVSSDSVHPPALSEDPSDRWFQSACEGSYGATVFETMYPGYRLGTGKELDSAMDLGWPLAVDVSHLCLQLSAGVLETTTLKRLFGYQHVAEVHLSDNDGRRDLHRQMSADTFGLAWSRERLRGGTPTIVECYMHRLSVDERLGQIDLVRG